MDGNWCVLSNGTKSCLREIRSPVIVRRALHLPLCMYYNFDRDY